MFVRSSLVLRKLNLKYLKKTLFRIIFQNQFSVSNLKASVRYRILLNYDDCYLACTCVHKSRYGAVGIVASLRFGQPRNRVSISDRGKRFYSCPQLPDGFLGPPSLVCNGCLELFPRKAG